MSTEVNTKSKGQSREKAGSEKKYTSPDGLKLTIGTTQKMNCKAIYLTVEGWITTDVELETIIRRIKQRYRSEWYHYTKEYFEGLKSNLLTIDNIEYGNAVKPGKTSFICFEFTLFNDWDWSSVELHVKLKEYGLSMVNKILDVDGFILTNYKK